MAESKAIEAPRLYPTLRCRDAEAMINWLKDVFGFSEHAVYRKDGVVQHAQLAFGSSILMLGQSRDDDYDKLVGDLKASRTNALYVAVDNPDAMHDRAKAGGAKIEMSLRDADYGNREFACRDPEGNLWSFGNYWPKANEKTAIA